MSVTILTGQPKTYATVYNDVPWIVTSDKRTEANFRYVCDIVVSGQPPARIKLSPNPTYGSALFNVGKVLESYVRSDISKTTYGFQQNLNSYVSYTVQFGEEYGLSSSGTTVYPNQVSNSSRYAYNSCLDFLEFNDYIATSFNDTPNLMVSGYTKGFLTDQPSTVKIRDNEDAWLYTMVNSSGTIYYANVDTYDAAGTILANALLVVNPYQAVASNNDRFVRFSCGTRNVNLIPSSGITSGTQPIIDSGVASYKVYLSNSSGGVVSNVQTYTIDNTCTKNDVYRMHFLNKRGGFDSFSFIRGSNKTVEVKRSIYKKLTGGLTSATTYGYNDSDRGVTQYDTSLKDTIKIKSDWISEDESVWLEQLVTSPEVYLDDATYGLVAINITNSNYSVKQTAQDKLFNLEIDFEYSFNRYRQRG